MSLEGMGDAGRSATSQARPVLIRSNFLSQPRCHEMIGEFLRIADEALNPSEHPPAVRIMQTRRTVAGRSLARSAAPAARNVITNLRERTIDAIRRFYGVEGPLHMAFTLLSEMTQGDQHTLHADNERQEADGTWVPNHTPMRDYTALVYLNTGGTDFEGGVLHFPVLHREIIPSAGQLIGFPCGREHQHQVTPLLHGRRYSIAMWLTTSPAHAESWE